MTALLEAIDISKSFVSRGRFLSRHTVKAVSPVSFALEAGQTLGIVGGNGSGKSTLVRMLSGVLSPDTGAIYLNDEILLPDDHETRCKFIRMVFPVRQNCFNPRQMVRDILIAPLKWNTNMSDEACEDRVNKTLKLVGLRPELTSYYPHMLAAGQQQRLSLARALVLQPSIIVADEVLSGLDISMQAQVINLFLDLQEEMGISFIYASQHIKEVRHLCDHVLVMHEGEVIELGTIEQVMGDPQHEITKKLLAASGIRC